jgi:hypothetical protein
MKKVVILILLLGFTTFGHFGFSQAIIVNPIDPVSNPLVDSLVGKLTGSGVIVQNIRSNLSETTRALATFRCDNQLLGGIKSGLMLVTGVADTMVGPNTGGIISKNINYSDTVDGCSTGRQMLNAVLAGNSTTAKATDCATIQFDIIPSTDSIKFNYVFASEEYNTFVCSNFNDIFGFFIQGPGINGDQNLNPTFSNTKNIAIIPGTNLPVSINTVNNGTPGSGLAANCTFTPQGIASYIDNTNGGADFPFIFNNLKFNGLTKKLQAAVKVIPCQTYTLTITISDVTDRAYDSGVFIEEGSLRSSGSSGVTVTQNSTFSPRFPYALIDCNPGKFIFKRCAADTVEPLVARYKISGTAINGIDFKQLRSDGQLVALPDSFVLASGEYIDSITLVGIDNPTWQTQPTKTVVIRLLNSIKPYINGQPNYRGDSTVLTIKRKFPYRASTDIVICNGSDSLLIPITPDTGGYQYHWVQLSGNDTIPASSLSCTDCDNPRTFANSTSNYVLFIKDSISGCISNDTVNVEVKNIPNPDFSSTINLMISGIDTFYTVQFIAYDTVSNETIHYWNFGDGEFSSQLNPIHVFFSDGSFLVCHTVTNVLGCSDTKCEPITLPLSNLDNFHKTEIQVFPNPANDFLNIISLPANSKGYYKLTDLRGVTIKTGDIEFDGMKKLGVLNLSSLAAGTYQLEIPHLNGVARKKIVLIK